MEGFTNVNVASVLIDKNSSTPVLLLKEKDGTRFLPIWIGIFEALSIAQILAGEMHERPSTYDLFSDTLKQVGCALKDVRVYDLKQGTFYAKLVLLRGESAIEVEARPSDAVALAVRQATDIFVSEQVMKQSALPDTNSLTVPDWDTILAHLPDDAFGKYHM